MNRRLRSTAASRTVVALLAAAAIATGLPGFAADIGAGAPVPSPGKKFTARMGKVSVPAGRSETFKTRSPIPFRPFELKEFGVNPKTGRQFQPGDPITLPRLKVPGTQQARKDSRTGRPLRDQKTGRILMDPRSGQPRVVKAKDLLAELNRIEEGMNRLGYSLRTTGSERIGRLRVDRAETDRQRREIAGKHIKSALPLFRPPVPALAWKNVPGAGFAERQPAVRTPSGAKPRFSTTVQAGSVTRAAVRPSLATSTAARRAPSTASPAGAAGLSAAVSGGSQGAASPRAFRPYAYDFNVSIPFGVPEVLATLEDFSVSLKCDERDMTFTHMKGTRAAILGYSVPLTNVIITAVVPTSADRDSTHDLMNQVLGVDLDFFPAHIRFTGRDIDEKYPLFSQDVDVSQPTTLALGPVPLSVDIGFRGSVGLSAGFEQHTGTHMMNAGIYPWVDTEVYVEAGVDYGAAEAGVGGSLVLVRDNMSIGPQVSAQTDEATGEPYFRIDFGAYNDLVMLAGAIYVYARVDYYVGEKEWTYDIWNDPGITSQGWLFNVSKTHYAYSDSLLDVTVQDFGDGQYAAPVSRARTPVLRTGTQTSGSGGNRTAPSPTGIEMPLVVSDNQYVGLVTVWDRDALAQIEAAGAEWRNVAGANYGGALKLAYREGDNAPMLGATGGNPAARATGLRPPTGPLERAEIDLTRQFHPYWKFTVPVFSEKSPYLVRIRVWKQETVTSWLNLFQPVQTSYATGAASRPKPSVTTNEYRLDVSPGPETELWLVYDLAQHRFRSWRIPGTATPPPPAIDRPAGEMGKIKGDNPSYVYFTMQDRGI